MREYDLRSPPESISGHLARGQVFGFDVSERTEDTITGGYTLYVVAGG